MTDWLPQLIALTTVSLLMIGPLLGVMVVLYFLISMPLRRQERGRILIDLLEVSSSNRISLSDVIRELCQTRDLALGVRFHVLGGYLDQGMSFTDAIRRVPRLLPPEIQGMLAIGESLGDYRKVLPACQATLNDAAQSVRNAIHNYTLLAVISFPTAVILFLFYLSVWPRFMEIFNELVPVGSRQFPPAIDFTLQHFGLFMQLILTGSLVLLAAAILYVGGPRLVRWIEAGFRPLLHGLVLRIPWKRSRLLRNFSLLLGILLDHGTPEAEAIPLAAQATGNRKIQRNALRCQAALAAGVPLSEAIREIDCAPELGWRLRVASQHEGGFRMALKGWWEWLHHRAARQENATAELISTSIVLINGFLIGSLGYAIFFVLVRIFDQAAIW